MRKAPIVPLATVRYYGPGEDCTDPAVGDLILVRHEGIPASLIRFGERLTLRGDAKVYGAVNHAMTVASGSGGGIVQEMGGGGGVLTPLSHYGHLGYAVVHVVAATDAQRAMAAEAARWYVGVPYGFPSIVTDAVYCLTRCPLVLGIGQSVVCSADACSAQRCLGLVPDKPDLAVMPSDLARYYDVRLPLAEWAAKAA